MKLRVGLARAAERRGRQAIQGMVGQFQARMLSGHEQAGRLAEIGKGSCNGTYLDGFRTRSDDKRNTRLAQLSP